MRLHGNYQAKQFMIQTRIISIILLVALGVINLQAQSPVDINNCLTKTDIDVRHLPSNMRIIVDDLDSQELVLLSPSNHSKSVIPKSSYINSYSGVQRSGIPILFDNGKRMLLFKEQNRQTMNIDGTNVIDMPDSLPQALIVHTSNDRGQVLFVEVLIDDTPWLEVQFQVLDATTGEVVDFNFPELVNFTQIPSRSDPTPIEWKVNPALDYQAYEARRKPIVDPYGINDLVRVQNILNGESYDIALTNSFILTWKSNYLLGVLDFVENIEYIIDVRSNELIAEFKFPPQDGLGFTLPTILSPDKQIYVYQAKDVNDQNFSVLIDENAQKVECLSVDNYPSQLLITHQDLQWSADSRFLWWLECKFELGSFKRCEGGIYNLMIFDREKNQYGVLLSDVGINTRIGFVDG